MSAAWVGGGRLARMIGGEISDPDAPRERHRWVFAYRLDGDLRFISHHDTLRLFRRALARARLPVRYSEGFNPHPRVMIPLPRSVGMASQAEVIVVEMAEPIDPDTALAELERHTPADIRMRGARRMKDGERLRPDLVGYRLDSGNLAPVDVEARARRILESGVVQVKRRNPADDTIRSIDIRPFIVNIVSKRDAIEFTLRVTDAGTARPAEIAGLLGFDPDSIADRIRRTEIRWQ